MSKELDVIHLEQAADYDSTLELQRALQQIRISGEGRDVLILCQHNPVITLGRRAKNENLLQSRESIESSGVIVREIERGGDVTYHGPGQLTAYPLLDLKMHRRDVDWFMRQLEQVIIDSLAAWGLQGERIPKNTGVWLRSEASQSSSEEESGQEVKNSSKIASIGVRISRWCTLHGFSVNVRDCSRGFSLIHPCGFDNISVSSLEEELGAAESPSVEEFSKQIEENFVQTFHYDRSREHAASTKEQLKIFKAKHS